MLYNITKTSLIMRIMLDKVCKLFVSSDTVRIIVEHILEIYSRKHFLNLLCIVRIIYIHDAILSGYSLACYCTYVSFLQACNCLCTCCQFSTLYCIVILFSN